MFRKTKQSQLDLFRDISSNVCDQAKKKLEDTTSWNQIVYTKFVSKIDESIYSVVYPSEKGRPNSSIRVLIGMMLLKEMNGWSDEQLFDECMFNLRVKASLGLRDLKETAPVASTYYDFRSKLARHLQNSGEDLIEQTFNQVCASQLEELDISGKKIRMDSKLIQSNIARQNRLQLIVETLRVSIKYIDITKLESELKASQYEILSSLQTKSTSNITYRLSKLEKEEMLEDCGQIIYLLIQLGYVGEQSVLYRVFEEQYERGEDDKNDDNKGGQKIGLKDPSKIGSGTVQSVHDTDAAYRKKGKSENVKIVKGYHGNITETCDEAGKPNLIIDVITTPANKSENEYLEAGIKRSQEKLGQGKRIEQVITDGGYDGKGSRHAMQQSEAPSWKMPKLKGPERVYKMEHDQQGELVVKDSKTNRRLEVGWSKKTNKHVVKNLNGTTRYFTKEQVKQYIQALEILDNTDDHDYNLRANVESTIHEVFHRLGRRHKIKYRSLTKCHWYVLMRAQAVNIGRISRYMTEKAIEKAILKLTALLKAYRIWKLSLGYMRQLENFIF